MPDRCPRCGFENPSGSVYCSSCGSPLNLGATPPPSRPPGSLPPAYVPPPDFGTIFSDTFRLYTKNFTSYFIPYLLLGAATSVPLAFLPSVRQTTSPPPGQLPTFTLDIGLFITLVLITVVAGLIVGSIIHGGLSYFTVQRHRGAPVDLRGALGKGLHRFQSILGSSILLALLGVALFLPPFVLIIIGLVTGNFALAVAGLFLLIAAIPVAIFVFVSFSLYAPAIMMEERGAVEGLSRSWGLSRGRRLTLFAVYLILGLIGGFITAAITTPVSLFRSPVASAIASTIANSIVGSWSIIAAAVAYDLITRYTPPPAYTYPPSYTYPQPSTGVPPQQGSPPPGGPPQGPTV